MTAGRGRIRTLPLNMVFRLEAKGLGIIRIPESQGGGSRTSSKGPGKKKKKGWQSGTQGRGEGGKTDPRFQKVDQKGTHSGGYKRNISNNNRKRGGPLEEKKISNFIWEGKKEEVREGDSGSSWGWGDLHNKG